MYLEKVDKVPKQRIYKPTKLFKILDEFVKSEAPIAKVCYTEKEYKDVESVRNSFRASSKRYGFDHIQFVVRNNDLYMVNTLING